MRDDFYDEVAKHASQPGTGATVNVRTGEQPQEGWAVAQAGHEHVEPRQSFSGASLRRYADQNRGALEQAGHMGLWHPSEKDAPGVYEDVTKVEPGSYAGGVRAIAGGYANQQKAIYNIKRGQELHMHPETSGQRRENVSAMAALRGQRPTPEGRIADMPTADLASALRNRKTVQEGTTP